MNFTEAKMLHQKDYFKGWYFKCCTDNQTIAFIPAFHIRSHKETASLQIITNDAAFNIPFNFLKYQENPLSAKLGSCIFSEKGIKLNINTDKLTANGALKFSNLSPIRYDIMGPFKFIPFMQCRHSVFSMKHQINGHLTINGQQYIFKNGIGYMEGDFGTSFPERYIWTQCHFKNGSLMLSAADIPLFGFHFTGIIGVVILGGKEYRIATYLGAKVKHISKDTVIIKQGDFQLTAKLLKKNAQSLYAPVNGQMSRTIHESISCKAYYNFSYRGKMLCEFISDKASFEFEYN